MSEKKSNNVFSFAIACLLAAFAVWQGYWYLLPIALMHLFDYGLETMHVSRRVRFYVKLGWIVMVTAPVIFLTLGWQVSVIMSLILLGIAILAEWHQSRVEAKSVNS